MERQCVKADTASGIVLDANDFVIGTVGHPAYPFELFCRVITVSLRTMEIVRSLPPLAIAANGGTTEPGLDRVGAIEIEAADAAE